MDDEPWTLERVAQERPELADLARMHLVLRDETERFATDGEGPAPRPGFAGPPALHWLAGRALIHALRPEVIADLASRLTVRLARRLAAEFAQVAEPVAEMLQVIESDEFDWQARIAEHLDLPGDDVVPHPPLFRFLLLRALAAPTSHVARSFSAPHSDRWMLARCPFCATPPAAAVAGTGGERRLLCVLCGGRWLMDGLACPTCGEESSDKLCALAAREAGPAALESCDTCKSAVKVFSESLLVPGPPLALEILTAGLDIVAERDHGVARAESALAGIFPPA